MTERLTIKRNNGDCVLKAESCCYGWYSFDVQESLRKEGTEILKKAIYKLAEYETAEEEGRLVVLPCKVGDTVWVITHPFNVLDDFDFYTEAQDEIYESYISSITFYENSNQYRIHAKETRQFIKAYFMESDFGKTVFLTREEAEKALKEMEKDDAAN